MWPRPLIKEDVIAFGKPFRFLSWLGISSRAARFRGPLSFIGEWEVGERARVSVCVFGVGGAERGQKNQTSAPAEEPTDADVV